MADDSGGAVLVGEVGFVFEAHDRLEEVVVEPQLVVEAINGQGVGDGVEAFVAEEVAHEGIVLLLNEAIVVGVARPTAGEEEVGGRLFEETDELKV